MKFNIPDIFKNSQSKKDASANATSKAPIFYGITSQVAESIDKYISIAGEPAVFTGSKEEVEKFKNMLFLDKYEVVSLDEAKKRYPESEIWVTYKRANITAKKLLKMYKPDMIHFFEADLEYKKSCNFLGHFIDYRVDNFSPCCVGKAPAVKTSGSVSERITHWEEYVTKLADDIKNGAPNPCDGCKHLKEGFYPRPSAKLDYICFATNHPGDVCNLRCTYCFVQNRFEKFKEDKEGLTTYETIKQLSQMPEYNSPNITIELSNGELCANKHCNEIFDVLLSTKWKVRFVTNMTIYNEKFAEFLKTGRTVNVLTSLDSGTPETYKKIKQVDCLNKVVENLKRYPLEKANLRLKYIFLEGVNDNETDVNGFYDIVKEVKCKAIMISSDRSKPFTEKIRSLVAQLIKKTKKDGIRVLKSAYLSRQDEKYIDELIEKEQTENNVQKTVSACKVINVDGKKISLDSNLLTDNAKYIIVLGDNSNITINGDIYVNQSEKKD